MMRNIGFILLILSFSLNVKAGQLFGRDDFSQKYNLPKTFGLSVDYYKVDQSYDIDQITLAIPVGNLNPSAIGIENNVDYVGIKADVWLLPYLNFFAVLGEIDGVTTVDLSSVRFPRLPITLGQTDINYDGDLYGGGFTLVAGAKKWFSSITVSYTDTSLKGNFQSSVSTLAIQPKVGLRRKKADFWLGATYLSTDESHQGAINLGGSGLPAIPFDVELSSNDKINYGAGLKYSVIDDFDLIAEFGVGGREHAAVSIVWRF